MISFEFMQEGGGNLLEAVHAVEFVAGIAGKNFVVDQGMTVHSFGEGIAVAVVEEDIAHTGELHVVLGAADTHLGEWEYRGMERELGQDVLDSYIVAGFSDAPDVLERQRFWP